MTSLHNTETSTMERNLPLAVTALLAVACAMLTHRRLFDPNHATREVTEAA